MSDGNNNGNETGGVGANKFVSRLIAPTVTDVVNRLGSMLTAGEMWTPSSLKSFLLYVTPVESKSFLNHQILPGILAHPHVQNFPTFHLSMSQIVNKITQGKVPSILAAVNETVTEANLCGGPNILVVQDINELLQLCKANQIPGIQVLRTIANVRGPKTLILGTSSMPPGQIDEPGFAEMFPRNTFFVANPREERLRSFYEEVLLDKCRASVLGCTKDQIRRVQEVYSNCVIKAATASDNHNHEDILQLADELLRSDITAEGNYTDILGSYQESRLRMHL